MYDFFNTLIETLMLYIHLFIILVLMDNDNFLNYCRVLNFRDRKRCRQVKLKNTYSCYGGAAKTLALKKRTYILITPM